MISGSIARRYAKALLLLGSDGASQPGKPNHNDAYAREIEDLAATWEGSAELREALLNPVFPLAQRRAVIEEVMRRLASSAIMRNFVLLLLERNRIEAVPSIARQFRAMVDAQSGRVRAVVTSAQPLSAALELRLKTALEKRTGKTVLLEKREDPALLGGVVTQIGDIVYDGSVRTQIERIRAELLAGA